MGIITDTKATLERYRSYGNEMKSLLFRHEVHSIDDLNRLAEDLPFQSEVTALWGHIVRAEGGAITLTVILSTIAIAMGGVGIAAGGGAIGLPLLVILAPAGYFVGQELDSEGYTKEVVDNFKKLLQMAQKFDSEQYTRTVANNFRKLLDSIHELDSEGYAKKAVDRFKKLLHKPADASS